MRNVRQGVQRNVRAGSRRQSKHRGIHLTREAKTQSRPIQCRIGQRLPERLWIPGAVHIPHMRHDERIFRYAALGGFCEIRRVEPVFDQRRRRIPPLDEPPLHAGAHHGNAVRPPQHAPLKQRIQRPGRRGHRQFFPKIDLRPGIPQIGKPGRTPPRRQAHQMGRMRRPRRQDGVEGLSQQLPRPRRREGNPPDPRIRHKQVRPNPPRKPAAGRRARLPRKPDRHDVLLFPAQQPGVPCIRIPCPGALHRRPAWNVRHGIRVGIGPGGALRAHGQHGGAPSEFGKIFRELEAALHAGPARRRKVVCNEKKPLHARGAEERTCRRLRRQPIASRRSAPPYTSAVEPAPTATPIRCRGGSNRKTTSCAPAGTGTPRNI